MWGCSFLSPFAVADGATGGALAWSRTFPGRLDQAKAARRFAAVLFADSPVVDEVELVAGELAANAIRHSTSGEEGGVFTLHLMVRDGLALVGVRDLGGRGIPAVRNDPLNTRLSRGRGLLAVSRLAGTLGVYGNPLVGHLVWAELDGAPPMIP
ncbi:ATP-binding protein [Actinomadura rayongensis]|nr:ATP-binding protein [Actinomadura rayongensis]